MITQNNTDKQWERFGKEDPYFGVLTHEKFHKENLSTEIKDEFFTSGKSHVERVLSVIKQKIVADFIPQKVLDFGCGVGRLVIPFAQIAGEVTGVDVSDSMLAEAKKNCEDRNLKNVNFLKSTDDMSNVMGKYNLIHSYIVFQHIPVKRGMNIFKKLLEHLEPNGVCAVHFSFGKMNKIQGLTHAVEKAVPFTGNAINVLRGRPFFAPRLQMNDYNLNEILKLVYKTAGEDVYIQIENHESDYTAMLFFKSKRNACY